MGTGDLVLEWDRPHDDALLLDELEEVVQLLR